jgi:hypothetical protein
LLQLFLPRICLPRCNHRHFLFCFQAVVSLTIRAATWLKSSRLRPGDALGWDLAGFFFSGLDAFLFPMPRVYAVHSEVQAPWISNCSTTQKSVVAQFEAGISDHVWSIEELCSLLPKAESAAKRVDKNLLLKALAKER